MESATESAEPMTDMTIDLRETSVRAETENRGRRRGLRIAAAWIAVTAALVGAILGAWWQDSRGVVRQATARVAFADEVSFGDLDAERSLIVTSSEATAIAGAIDGVRNVELKVPEARSHIDVEVRADTAAAAAAGADAVTAELIATHARLETSDLEATLADTAESIALLDEDISALEASMENELATEAEANAVLTGELSAEDREELTVTAREASDAYWNLTRERNALLDQRNSYVRTQTDSENALRTAGNLRVVEASTVEPLDGLDPVVSSAIGGGLLGLGIAIFAFWAIGRLRLGRT